MPLPKPPAKRAALLSAEEFESQAPPLQPRKTPKSPAAAEPQAVTALYGTQSEPSAPVITRPPVLPPPPARHVHRHVEEPRRTKPRGDGPARLFVLDTNVLMHDPMSLYRFEEHDIYLPMITLEELDSHKRGMSEVSRNVRQVSRELDALAGDSKLDPGAGIPLAKTGHREAGGKLFFQTQLLNVQLPVGLPQGKADNQILGVVQSLREQHGERDVVLVSKDINMRVKARALGLPAEDYFNDKTLLTLASGLVQVMDERCYTEIIVTRVTVPVGEDIGFLPGTEEEKMGPWMGALDDNLEVLSRSDSSVGEWGRAATNDLVRSKIKIKSLNFMRGRTFLNKFVIIDEAQNLTPKQMKTLITRAGPGTKIVCLGNLAQIDTPYLTEGSSGLTYAVDRFKGWPHSGHIMLARGERSRLADFASDVL